MKVLLVGLLLAFTAAAASLHAAGGDSFLPASSDDTAKPTNIANISASIQNQYVTISVGEGDHYYGISNGQVGVYQVQAFDLASSSSMYTLTIEDCHDPFFTPVEGAYLTAICSTSPYISTWFLVYDKTGKLKYNLTSQVGMFGGLMKPSVVGKNVYVVTTSIDGYVWEVNAHEGTVAMVAELPDDNYGYFVDGHPGVLYYYNVDFPTRSGATNVVPPNNNSFLWGVDDVDSEGFIGYDKDYLYYYNDSHLIVLDSNGPMSTPRRAVASLKVMHHPEGRLSMVRTPFYNKTANTLSVIVRPKGGFNKIAIYDLNTHQPIREQEVGYYGDGTTEGYVSFWGVNFEVYSWPGAELLHSDGTSVDGDVPAIAGLGHGLVLGNFLFSYEVRSLKDAKRVVKVQKPHSVTEQPPYVNLEGRRFAVWANKNTLSVWKY